MQDATRMLLPIKVRLVQNDRYSANSGHLLYIKYLAVALEATSVLHLAYVHPCTY